METKLMNGRTYVSSNVNEWKDICNAVSWENITNLKKIFYNNGLTSSLTNFPMSEAVDMVQYDCRCKIDSDLNSYLEAGVCAKDEIKLEYIGYSAILITYYWYVYKVDLLDLAKVPYIGDGQYQNFANNVFNYIGVPAQSASSSFIRRVIKDASFDFLNKHLSRYTRNDGRENFLTPAGRKLAWEDAADDMFRSCHVLEMQRLGF